MQDVSKLIDQISPIYSMNRIKKKILYKYIGRYIIKYIIRIIIHRNVLLLCYIKKTEFSVLNIIPLQFYIRNSI